MLVIYGKNDKMIATMTPNTIINSLLTSYVAEIRMVILMVICAKHKFLHEKK